MYLLGACDARMPQRGDQVRIVVNFGSTVEAFEGNITDIGDGLIVMNATGASVGGDTIFSWEAQDIAIGIGSIVSLYWVK